MRNTKRGRPRKPPEPGTEPNHVARVLEDLTSQFGTQAKLAAKIGPGMSRPLLTQILNGRTEASALAVAGICRVCDPQQAMRLLTAHLEDELARVLRTYRQNPGAGWDGKLEAEVALSRPARHSASPAALGQMAVDVDNMNCFRITEID